MPLSILGLNHNTAPVEIREQVVFEGDAVNRAISAVAALTGVSETVVLSTCNRTEFYIESEAAGHNEIRAWLKTDLSLDDDAMASLFSVESEDAIRHLFRVACGLDSMVLGEPQILGQLKDAFRQAEQLGSVGPKLSRLFHLSLIHI